MTYNTVLEVFPNNFIATMGSFQPGTLLESTESAEEKKVVKVSFT